MFDFENLRDEVLRLPDAERSQLICDMLASLEPEPDSDAAQAWGELAVDRLRRYERGELTVQDWRESLAEVRATLLSKPKT